MSPQNVLTDGLQYNFSVIMAYMYMYMVPGVSAWVK